MPEFTTIFSKTCEVFQPELDHSPLILGDPTVGQKKDLGLMHYKYIIY